MIYQNIVFDLDDTLYDHLLPFKNSIKKCFPSIDLDKIDHIYARFRFWSDVAFPKYTKELISIEELRIFRCQKTMAEFGVDTVSEEEAIAFQKEYEDQLTRITLIPEVRELLELLVTHQVPIGLLTNGPVDLQTKKLINLEALPYFDKNKILISQSTGYNKPQREIFELTLEKFQFAPNETVFIGDTFINDIEGSFNVGAIPVWFNHRNRPIPEGKEKVHYFEVQTPKALTNLIKQLFSID